MLLRAGLAFMIWLLRPQRQGCPHEASALSQGHGAAGMAGSLSSMKSWLELGMPLHCTPWIHKRHAGTNPPPGVCSSGAGWCPMAPLLAGATPAECCPLLAWCEFFVRPHSATHPAFRKIPGQPQPWPT